jgi:NAD-dependent dihydropyrimidine dehydrogenase PreA subunit
VYDTAKAPTPVVIKPEECVDHCHGCGNRCPVGAITYVGEDTGWTPPNGKPEAVDAGCSCGCGAERGKNEAPPKRALVEYLYLDLETCERCVETDAALDEVMAAIAPALKMAGFEVEYKKLKIESPELAEKYKLLSSPTVRVNGRDICGPVEENSCGRCGEICGAEVNCRVLEHAGETYEAPPKELLAEGLLRAVFGEQEEACACGYVLPDNLKRFFKEKSVSSGCRREAGCCG